MLQFLSCLPDKRSRCIITMADIDHVRILHEIYSYLKEKFNIFFYLFATID